jgi:hypothetical protein
MISARSSRFLTFTQRHSLMPAILIGETLCIGCSQGAGLLKRDFMGLDTDLPFVRVTKHPWRNLKTASSECKVPLIDETLWAVRRMVEADNGLDFAFPRYNRR